MLPPPSQIVSCIFLNPLWIYHWKWMNRFCIVKSCLESERKLWNQELINLLITSQTFLLDFDTTEPDQIDLQNRIFLCEFKTKNAGVRMCLLQSCQFDRKLLHSALLPLWCMNMPSTFDLTPGWPLPKIRTKNQPRIHSKIAILTVSINCWLRILVPKHLPKVVEMII